MRGILPFILLVSACAPSTSAWDRYNAAERAKIAAIPDQVEAEFVAKYGPDKSKWPQRPEGVSTCQEYNVWVSGTGGITGGDVLIC